MNHTQSIGNKRSHFAVYTPIYLRFLLPVVVLSLLLSEKTREVTIGVLSDAFFQVGVFVAATLALYHGVRHLSQYHFQSWLRLMQQHQVPAAAFLGALPGCGGAIIVVTQFIRGQSNFGSVVAVLTATMGDAAFVLLATRPVDGLLIMALSVVAGIVSGYVVNALHSDDFMRTDKVLMTSQLKRKPKQKSARILWQWLLVPGITIGLLMALQVDVAQLLGLPDGMIEWLGALFVLTALGLWCFSSAAGGYQELVAEDVKESGASWLNDVAHDTNFVLAWVVVAFLLFELFILFTGFDLGAWLSLIPALTPFLAIMVGLLPGCGPQIIVTTLYIEGQVPLSAQIGNAISNDGDALFPAIALAPKAALLATLYSTVPAILLAYGYFLVFE